MKTHKHLAIGLLTGASVLALAAMANAQAQDNSANPAQVEQVVVTGSRVIANGNDMPTPVTVVSPAQLTLTAPSSPLDALEELPVFDGSQSNTSNVGNSSQNHASHEFNIRNIGTTRTLVLYNGRRIGSTAPTGEVDADIIPEMLLKRVDVVTGGVSAVYGSDAVSGVVNFITDNAFNGIKANAQGGISQYGDGGTERVGVAGGMPVLDGKGHIEGSFEFYNNLGIAGAESRQRPWFAATYSAQGGGTPANPNVLVSNTRLASSSYSGYIVAPAVSTANTGNPLAGMEFAGPGNTLVPFTHGAATGTSNVESGGDGIYYSQASLEATIKQFQAFGRFDYDFNDNLSGYVDLTGTKIGNTNIHQTNEFRNFTLSSTNAYLPTVYQNQMLAAGDSTFVFSKAMLQAPPLQSRSMTTSVLLDAGLTGTVWDKYHWDFSFVHNENEQYTHNPANPSTQKESAAMDAVVAPAGNGAGVAAGTIVCNVTLTNPGLYPGCVPLNMFGNGSETPAMLNYILDDTHFRAMTTLNDVGGSISGPIFDLPAGPLSVALNGEWRQQTFDLTSNAQASAHANCTGLRYNCTSSTLLYISNVVSDSHGLEQSVGEGAVELGVPLLKDLFLAKDVTADLAARYTDYDTSGTVWTWKAGLEWHVDDELSLRGVMSRDIRAPNLNELFAATLVNPAGTTDYHVTNAAGQPTQLQANFDTVANPNLKPEVAITQTVGVVYRPAWLDNFSVSVDYYHIKIGNAISVIQGQNQTIQQICESSNGTSPYCALILRPLPFANHTTANEVTDFLDEPENAQSLVTDGWEIEMNYQTDDWGPGHFSFRNLAEYQPFLKTVQFPGAPTLNTADAPGEPTLRDTVFMGYKWDAWGFNLQERIRNGTTRLNSNPLTIYAASFPVPQAAAYTNINISYDWTDQIESFFTVEDLFNRTPTIVGGGGTVPGLFPSSFAGDDNIGRYFTVGVKFKMD